LLISALLLKRLQDDQTWLDLQDADGGVTSQLASRIVLEEDNWPRASRPPRETLPAASRPGNADALEKRIRELEAELTA